MFNIFKIETLNTNGNHLAKFGYNRDKLSPLFWNSNYRIVYESDSAFK